MSEAKERCIGGVIGAFRACGLVAVPAVWLAVALAVPGALATASDAPSSSPTPSSAPPPAGQDFGAGLTIDRVTDLGAVVEHPERYEGEAILLAGRISDVCQRKGCWTILSQGEHHVRVRFKDYGFFIPTDSSGRRAYVEGVVKVEELSEKDVRHYKGESRRPDSDEVRAFDRSVGFTASGVRLIAAD